MKLTIEKTESGYIVTDSKGWVAGFYQLQDALEYIERLSK